MRTGTVAAAAAAEAARRRRRRAARHASGVVDGDDHGARRQRATVGEPHAVDAVVVVDPDGGRPGHEDPAVRADDVGQRRDEARPAVVQVEHAVHRGAQLAS